MTTKETIIVGAVCASIMLAGCAAPKNAGLVKTQGGLFTPSAKGDAKRVTVYGAIGTTNDEIVNVARNHCNRFGKSARPATSGVPANRKNLVFDCVGAGT